MTLAELKREVDEAVAWAKEFKEFPDKIIVSLQIDKPDGKSIWSKENVELHYDNNGNTSGCVLTAIFEEED